jgi:hypothetical protein
VFSAVENGGIDDFLMILERCLGVRKFGFQAIRLKYKGFLVRTWSEPSQNCSKSSETAVETVELR